MNCHQRTWLISSTSNVISGGQKSLPSGKDFRYKTKKKRSYFIKLFFYIDKKVNRFILKKYANFSP